MFIEAAGKLQNVKRIVAEHGIVKEIEFYPPAPVRIEQRGREYDLMLKAALQAAKGDGEDIQFFGLR